MPPEPASTIVYVNPTAGADSSAGTQAAPYKTLTQALRTATAGTTVQLLPGTYTAANGEKFPLVIPEGVTVRGEIATHGRGIVIEGSGEYASPTFSTQNVTVLPQNRAQLQGVTVVNRAPRGTAVWIESTTPAIAHNTFTRCGREGIFITGTAIPLVLNNILVQNAASGISIARNAKGEIRQNLCQNTGFGIAVNDHAAPLVSHNRTLENRSGIVLAGDSRAVLRQNQIEKNSGDGLVILHQARPDLGSSQDPGGNVIAQNKGFDLHNATTTVLVSGGNQLNPTRVQGSVEFVVSLVSPFAPTGTPPTPPTPNPQPPIPNSPTPNPPDPLPRPVRLSDIEGHWAQVFMQGLVSQGILSGFPDGTFRPNAPMTRAQFAAVLSQAFQQPAQRDAPTFADVAADFWAQKAIVQAFRMGFLAGFPDQTFRPNQNLTRIQALVALVSGLNLTGGSTEVLLRYRDRAQIPSYAIARVATATQNRLVVNYPQVAQLEPLRDITRAEVAGLVYQALVATGKAASVPSPFIVNPELSLPSFTDLQGHWGADFVRSLGSQGLISGFADGSFQPNVPMTRAQYAALIVKAFQPPPKRPATTFTDIAPDFWAAAAIQQAYRGGFLMGFSDNSFRPEQNVLRVHVIASLVTGLNLPAASDLTDLQVYQDLGLLAPIARPLVATATQQGLVVNYPSQQQLEPSREATRAEVAAMVYQGLVNLGRSPALNSPYIVTQGNLPMLK